MAKKKSKKKKSKLPNYKLFVTIGAIFHFIVYLLQDRTLYNDSVFWLSALICGLFFGVYFIIKMKLTNPKSYRKIKGFKLKMYMTFICLIMILGGIVIFGNVLNGTILGLNFIGKNSESSSNEYKIEKIVKNRISTGRRRSLSKWRKTVPRVYYKKNGEVTTINLWERYNSKKDYESYETLKLNTYDGLLGFEVIEAYYLEN